MRDDRLPEDVKTVWTNQAVDPLVMSPEDIAARTSRFRSRIRRRNLVEYAAALLVVVAFGAYFLVLPGAVARAGCVLVILGTAYVVFQLHRRGGVRTTQADPSESAIAFQRRELVRQRDLLRDVWRWYIGPFVPGLAVFLVGRAMEGASGGWAAAVVSGAICGFVLYFIWRMNQNAAERIEAEIAVLDAATDDKQADARP